MRSWKIELCKLDLGKGFPPFLNPEESLVYHYHSLTFLWIWTKNICWLLSCNVNPPLFYEQWKLQLHLSCFLELHSLQGILQSNSGNIKYMYHSLLEFTLYYTWLYICLIKIWLIKATAIIWDSWHQPLIRLNVTLGSVWLEKITEFRLNIPQKSSKIKIFYFAFIHVTKWSPFLNRQEKQTCA